jgi:hypothetical protein
MIRKIITQVALLIILWVVFFWMSFSDSAQSMVEQKLVDVFTWTQWFWWAGVSIAIILFLYFVPEFVKTIRRKIK